VRLRVAVRYPTVDSPAVKQEGEAASPPLVNQWFWREPDAGWGERGPATLNVKADGEPHVYWTFLSLAEIAGTLTGLRFDPINAGSSLEILWIALDLVR
jgi:hypothetical protein